MTCNIFFIILLFIYIFEGRKTTLTENIGCFLRDFGNDNKVCVCNATHCDVINSIPPFPSRKFNMYLSDKKGSRFAYSRKNLGHWINPKSIKIIVNSNETYQKIIGFGGSLSDAAAINMNLLSEDARNHFLFSYFSNKGIEYNLLRIPIGGNDYSNRPYTLDDVDNDLSLSYFKLSYEDFNLKIPNLLKIMKVSNKEVRIVGTAWTAPPWMKTNNDYTGIGTLKEKYYSLWSKYFIRFLEEYDKFGLKVWGITTGYQPFTGLIPFYPLNCMGWTPLSQTYWIFQNLGPDLRNSKFNKTNIIILDDSRFFLPWWPKLVFKNQKTKAYVNGIGVQWYWNFLFPSRLLDLTKAEFPDKFIISTEASFNKWKGTTSPLILGSWERAEEYAESIIEDLNHWVSGWMDSNLALDLKGGPSWAKNFADAAVIVNGTGNEFYKQPLFYAMGHFSKFIPKGSIRIDLKISKSGIKAVGFRTPQKNVVIIMVNKKTFDVPITILGAKMGNANFFLPKKAIITVIYRDKKK